MYVINELPSRQTGAAWGSSQTMVMRAWFLIGVLTLGEGKVMNFTGIGQHTVINQMEGADNTTEVLLSDNELTSLSWGGFSSMYQLQLVDLSRNSLREVRNNDFEGTIVSSLTLDNNRLTCVPTLKSLYPTLRILRLASNRLEDCFGHLSLYAKLSVLDLSDNRLVAIPNATFNGSRLQVLLLNSNRFTCQPDLSALSKTLWKIDLSENQITDCKTDVGYDETFTMLGTIDLHKNKKTSVEPYHYRSSSLSELRLSHNGLVCVPRLGKAVRYIASSTMKRCTTNSSTGTLKAFTGLEILDLRHNAISFINTDAFVDTRLKELWLDQNVITCLPNLSPISATITFLNISNNNFSECDSPVSYGGSFPHLIQAAFLNTGLTSLPALLTNSPRLVHLSADDNIIALLKQYFMVNKTTTTTTSTTTTTPSTPVPTYLPFGFVKLVPKCK